MEIQRRDLGSVGPIGKGWTSPFRIVLGQNESVMLAATARAFAEEVQRMLFPSGVRDGVSLGRSRTPLLSQALHRNRMVTKNVHL